jgi:hypothetical protein
MVESWRRWWRLDKSPVLRRRRRMGQSVVSDAYIRDRGPLEPDRSIAFLRSELLQEQGGRPFVAIVRTKDEFLRYLHDPPVGLQWVQVEGLLEDPDPWAQAAHGDSEVALDVLLAAPASEFSGLYRLVDVSAVRHVRVSMPALPGFSKAVRLAAALRLPVRLLPGQPTPEVLSELAETLTFYLCDPMVEAPVEFFHSVLAFMCGADTGSLWTILEEDPALFPHQDGDGSSSFSRFSGSFSFAGSVATFVESRLKSLIEQNAECATCPWQRICEGYFKCPDAAYICTGVKQLFSAIKEAANEMGLELARRDLARSEDGSGSSKASSAIGSNG